ncbi:polycystin-1-like [Pan paniscus]|uniref:polycystin-1-like n=1 Tax=Pan paniscus TaxID=9597 RepID=UPI0024364796|nr:polycystin-1-like isoform X1 [Pan paniscus]
MAFQTRAGAQIPIERLASERAITVKVPNNSDWAARGHRSSANSVVVQPQASVGAVVTLDSSNPAAVLHLQLNYTLLDGRYLSEESEPYLVVCLHSEPRPNEHNCSASRRIRPESLQGADHRPYTFFISPGSRDPVGSYHLNLSSHFRWSALEVSVGLYASLCQYFSEEDMVWRTEGLLPLEETSPCQAVCLTRHLTAFGASLFVPPSHVRFVFPEPTADVNYIVMLTCAVCLVTYMVMAAILHKLDQLDASRGRAIPFCRQRGRFKYEILVKTGWGRGSGTTAHVGIMLYGVDSRSSHWHLDGDRAFHRNSLDIFRIATSTAWVACRRSECGTTTKGSALPGSCTTSSSGTCRRHTAPSSWSMTGFRWRRRPTGVWWRRRCWPRATQPCCASGACWWLSCSAASLTSTSGSPYGTGCLVAVSLASRGPPPAFFSSASSWAPTPCGTGLLVTLPTGGWEPEPHTCRAAGAGH